MSSPAEGLTERQAAALDDATRWAQYDARVRALVLKGSLARGEGDALSDLDLVIVAQPGRREELWRARSDVAEELGEPLGLFREAPWQAPYTAIALYDGPLKVDLFFQEGEVEPDPWLGAGFAVLLDKADVRERLEERLHSFAPPAFGPAELRELDAHAWDWIWWLHVKLTRGVRWLAWVELTLLVEHVVLYAYNALAGEPWAGAYAAERRLDAALLAELDRALPHGTEGEELRRSVRALGEMYVRARGELAKRLEVELDDRLMEQVLAAAGP